MSICARPNEFASLRMCVRDFGSGPCLATESHGATIVLTAFSADRRGRVEMRACDERGVLTAEAARPVLERMVALWNANLAKPRCTFHEWTSETERDSRLFCAKCGIAWTEFPDECVPDAAKKSPSSDAQA